MQPNQPVYPNQPQMMAQPVYGDPNQQAYMQQQQQPVYYDPNQPQMAPAYAQPMQQQTVYASPVEPQPMQQQPTTVVIVQQQAPVRPARWGLYNNLGCAIALLVLWCILLVLNIILWANGWITFIAGIIWIILDGLLVAWSAYRVHVIRQAQIQG